jgi:TetR/AcrR family transcriptional repressor of nem operon
MAGKLFRQRGYTAVGVAEVMRSAGLSHGGFYANFGSKDDLIAESTSHAMAANIDYWRRMGEDPAKLPPGQMVGRYLREAYAEASGEGCVIAALGSEIARQDKQVRAQLTDQIKQLVDLMAEMMPQAELSEQRRQALVAYSAMVGALVLARVSSEEAFSQEIITAIEDSL